MNVIMKWLRNSFWYMVVGAIYDITLVLMASLNLDWSVDVAIFLATSLAMYPLISFARSKAKF